MTYELAKQLKDAGWKVNLYDKTKEFSSISLSELIEACGDKIYVLCTAIYHDKESLQIIHGWACNGMVSFGKTPEEAVAKLWLELNKK